jgi:hypothetical protein
MINGLQVIVSEHALEETEVRLFPASKNRSKRIHKKLVKRHGGEFEKRPCIYRMDGKLVMHPVMWERMQREIAHKQREDHERAFYGAYSGNPW